eukprot:CAMPEP_0176485476 /NCGR_PEP_ID=MMETSP0200_2-20121128/5057_1 /TAXON_ID=947934 /ORGANISM="Chaetoceros sp., Strain GSL56" /LENGTH=498 /DNA_ID=CAMNT_0017882117 /DNA_START=114 /DNA_END=1610 /DNA_ORIENTATION=+
MNDERRIHSSSSTTDNLDGGKERIRRRDNEDHRKKNDEEDDVATYSVKFLVDKSPRDVQTAYAMMDGMADIAKKSTKHPWENKTRVVIKGLDVIEIEPRLFDPMKNNGFRDDDNSSDDHHGQDAICDVPSESVEDKIRNIEQRYKNAPQPYNFTETLLWIQYRGGKNFMDFFVDNDGSVKEPSLAEDASHFQGAFNLIKYVAEALFYSRASGLNFWENNATTEDTYVMMTWIHWSRYVLSIGNNETAAKGGVIMSRILQELEHFDDKNDGYDDNNHHATFIIGHDGDLDAVATALGISWNLPHPYHPGYSPTPPGSAIHFSYNGNEVEVSFLAPILLNTHVPFLNSSGILEEVPVLFIDDFKKESTIRGSVTVIPSIASLRNRTVHVMEQYSGGALTCFHAAERIWHQITQSSSSADDKEVSFYPGNNVYIYFYIVVGCSILLGCIIRYFFRGGGTTMMKQNIRFLVSQNNKYFQLKARTQRTSTFTAKTRNSEGEVL